MWTKTYSKTFRDIKREAIWRLWADVNHWPAWRSDLESCKLENDFAPGNHFLLKPKGANPVKIVLTEIDPEHRFTACTSFFGAKMYDTHIMTDTANGLQLTSKLVVTGPLKWFWIKRVAQRIADIAPEETENLVKIARSHPV